MHKEFWLERWNNRQIGFDQPSPNSLLVKHYQQLNIKNGGSVFVPLTGKSVDVVWLLSNGYRVKGCELSEQAVIELFELLNVTPSKSYWEHGIKYSTEDLSMFVGDFFDLQQSDLGQVDGVYDRASKVALPPEMRVRYTQHLATITQNSPQLLIVFDYDQNLVPGPPFSVPEEEIKQNYEADFKIKLLEELQLSYGIKGVAPATENAWYLKKIEE